MNPDGLVWIAFIVIVVAVLVFVIRKAQVSARNERSGIAGWGDAGLPADPALWPLVITRMYGGNFKKATDLAAEESPKFAAQGYVVVGQQYVPGSWSTSAWIIALLLIVFVVGLLVLVFMVVAKPPGTLTVTYQRQAPQAPESPMRQVFPVSST